MSMRNKDFPYSFAPTTILMNSPGFGSGAGSVTVSPQA